MIGICQDCEKETEVMITHCPIAKELGGQVVVIVVCEECYGQRCQDKYVRVFTIINNELKELWPTPDLPYNLIPCSIDPNKYMWRPTTKFISEVKT